MLTTPSSLPFGKGGGSRRIFLFVFSCLFFSLPGFSQPASEMDLLQSAVQAYYQGDYPQSAQGFRTWLVFHPTDKEAARDLAAVLREQGEYAQAGQVLEQYRVDILQLAEVRLSQGDGEGAASALRAVLKLPGSPFRGRLMLGLLSQLHNLPQDAMHWYWLTAEEFPREPIVHLLLARVLDALTVIPSEQAEYFSGRARDEYRTVLKLDDSYWTVHRDQALLAEREGRWDAARAGWNRVREVVGEADEVNEALERLAKVPATPTPVPTLTPTPSATPVQTAVHTATPTPGPRLATPPRPFREYSLAPLGFPDEPRLRVGLGSGLRRLRFGSPGPWKILDAQNRVLWQGQAQKFYLLEWKGSKRLVLRDAGEKKLRSWKQKAVFIVSSNPRQPLVMRSLYATDGYYWSSGSRKTGGFRGRMQLLVKPEGFTLVNWVHLEEYVAGVVPGEMPSDWPGEALKAQAVAARTDALVRRGTHSRQGYDVCSTAHCAAYQGVEVEDSRTLAAVAATSGQVLAGNGRILPAFYSHACGGMTQSAAEAWGKEPTNFPASGIYDAEGDSREARRAPLRPAELEDWLWDRPEVFCGTNRFASGRSFRWKKIYTRQELTLFLDPLYHVGTIRSLRVLNRSATGYVRALEVEGDKDRRVIRGDAIRGALGGLRSNLFVLLPLASRPGSGGADCWLICGGGWGHGVGFCQVGAAEMGRQGYACEEILRHYFPAGEVKAFSEVEDE